MPQAVQIGAGKIGRGFLGALMHEGGYEITFVDTDTLLVERLNTRRSYRLNILTEDFEETLTVAGFQAIKAQDKNAVREALCCANVIAVSVGVANLPEAAHTLARGINARAELDCGPVDVLICENQWHAAPLLRSFIEPYIAPYAQAYFENHVGLVEAVIERTVPTPSDALCAEDPLLLVADAIKELPVARDMMRGPPPHLPGLLPARDIEAYEARKLYLHNMGHATLAYLGYLRGYKFLWQCATDNAVTSICRQAFHETSRAIAVRYAFTAEELAVYTHDLMRGFANKALSDTITRVAADPGRKLRPSDRLVGAANLCLAHGIPPLALAIIIAAALRYDNPADLSAVQLQSNRRAEGDTRVLETLCELPKSSTLSALVLNALQEADLCC